MLVSLFGALRQTIYFCLCLKGERHVPLINWRASYFINFLIMAHTRRQQKVEQEHADFPSPRKYFIGLRRVNPYPIISLLLLTSFRIAYCIKLRNVINYIQYFL